MGVLYALKLLYGWILSICTWSAIPKDTPCFLDSSHLIHCLLARHFESIEVDGDWGPW